MDMQKLIDAMNASAQISRSGYHVTLGQMTAFCADAPADADAVFDTGDYVGTEASYRGHYHDVAFEPTTDRKSVADLLEACRRAATDTYEGYKGGDYTYDDKTPTWCARYGNTGSAIVGVKMIDGRAVFETRFVD